MKRWTIVLPILAIALFLLIPKPQRSSKTELPTPSSPQSKPSPPSGESWQVIRVSDGSGGDKCQKTVAAKDLPICRLLKKSSTY